MRVVAALDEREDGHLGFGLRLKVPPIPQLAFEGGEEALAHRVVEAVADRAIEGRTPASLQRNPKAMDLYCVPCSE